METFFYLCLDFIFYSFAGWIIEGLYSAYKKNGFMKEGFLIEPLKPMYGTAVTLLIICHQYLHINGAVLLMLSFLIPTTVEFITGAVLDTVFGKVYWDYSDIKFNVHGYICPVFSVYWCFLSYAAVVYIHPLIMKVINIHSLPVFIGLLILMTAFVFDSIFTITDAVKDAAEQ